MIRFTQDFKKDFDQFYLEGEPYAFARFGDGERSLCMGHAVTVKDGWSYDGSDTPLALKMRDAVGANVPGYYIGISCPCRDPQGHDWYMFTVPRNAVNPPFDYTDLLKQLYEVDKQIHGHRTRRCQKRWGPNSRIVCKWW